MQKQEKVLLRPLDAKGMLGAKLRNLFPEGCRRILLVHPPNVPEEDWNPEVAWDNRYPVYPPTGLGTLSRALQIRGYPRSDIEILDLNFLLQKLFKEDRASFRHEVWKDILRERVETFGPDLVGLGCMFTIYYRQMKRMAEYIKEWFPSLPVIGGGVHTSDAAELVARDCPAIDIICRFEGNQSFPDMLDFVNGHRGEEALTQLAALIDGQDVAINERAPKTPESMNLIPDYHDLPVGEYSPQYGRIGTYYWLWEPGIKAGTVLSNIGCRAQCTFCSVRYFNGYGVFTRDIGSVVDEIEFLRDAYGITHIMWLDDDLLYDPRRAIALFNEMVRRDVGITWDASNGVIASAVTEENAAAMAESGCIGLSFGVESGSPEILKAVKKPSGVKHFYRCMEILKRHPQIFTKALLMCGFPNETIGQVLETVKVSTEAGFDWGTIQPLNYIPGVEITNHMLEQGKIDKQAMLDGSERPFVGSTGKQIKREEKERTYAPLFIDPLEGNLREVPAPEKIPDVWFSMDYRINYKPLVDLQSPVKLAMLHRLFINICDNTHHTNALGNLYFSVIEQKLGNREETQRRLRLARRFSGEIAYWRVRFETLGLNRMLDELQREWDDPKT